MSLPSLVYRNSPAVDFLAVNDAFADLVGLSKDVIVNHMGLLDLQAPWLILPEVNGTPVYEWMGDPETGKLGYDELVIGRFAFKNYATGKDVHCLVSGLLIYRQGSGRKNQILYALSSYMPIPEQAWWHTIACDRAARSPSLIQRARLNAYPYSGALSYWSNPSEHIIPLCPNVHTLAPEPNDARVLRSEHFYKLANRGNVPPSRSHTNELFRRKGMRTVAALHRALQLAGDPRTQARLQREVRELSHQFSSVMLPQINPLSTHLTYAYEISELHSGSFLALDPSRAHTYGEYATTRAKTLSLESESPPSAAVHPFSARGVSFSSQPLATVIPSSATSGWILEPRSTGPPPKGPPQPISKYLGKFGWK